MKKISLFFILILLFLIGGCASKQKINFGYSEKLAPKNWYKLDGSYYRCKEANIVSDVVADKYHQSPINISNTKRVNDIDFKVKYKDEKYVVYNNGFTVSYIPQNNSKLYIEYKDVKYHLTNIYIHTPSEHTVLGKHYLMELEIVNQDDRLNQFNLSILIDNKNLANAEFLKMTNIDFPDKYESNLVSFNVKQILPPMSRVYSYLGSQTIPPCKKVTRRIFANPISTNSDVIKKFKEVYNNNSRPTTGDLR
jgi:carbonic anhydrase